MTRRLLRDAGYFGVVKALNMLLALAVTMLVAQSEPQGQAALFLFFQPLLYILASLAPLGVNLELMERIPKMAPEEPGVGEAAWGALSEGLAYVGLSALVLAGGLGASLAVVELRPWMAVLPLWLLCQGASLLVADALRATGEVLLAALGQGTVALGLILAFLVVRAAQGEPFSFVLLALVAVAAHTCGTVVSLFRLRRFVGPPSRRWMAIGAARALGGWRDPVRKVARRVDRLGATAFVGLAQQIDTVLGRFALPPIPFNDFAVASRLGNLALIPRMLVLRAFGPHLSSGVEHGPERIRVLNQRIGWAQLVLGGALVLAFLAAARFVPPLERLLGATTDLKLVAIVLAGRLAGVSFGLPDFLLSMKGAFRQVTVLVGASYLAWGTLLVVGLYGFGLPGPRSYWVAAALGLAFATSRGLLHHRYTEAMTSAR